MVVVVELFEGVVTTFVDVVNDGVDDAVVVLAFRFARGGNSATHQDFAPGSSARGAKAVYRGLVHTEFVAVALEARKSESQVDVFIFGLWKLS